MLADIILIYDAIKQLFVGRLMLEVELSDCQSSNFSSFNVSKVNITFTEKLLKQHQYVGHLSPFLDIGSLKRHELRSLLEEDALSDYELVKGVFVHEFVVIAGLG